MNCNCNNGFMGCGSNSWWIILIIFFLFCGCGNSCGCGCGCGTGLIQQQLRLRQQLRLLLIPQKWGPRKRPFPLGKMFGACCKASGARPLPLQQALFITAGWRRLPHREIPAPQPRMCQKAP